MIRYFGWALTLIIPVAVIAAMRFVPYPGSLLALGAVIGTYIGYVIYEHVEIHEYISSRTAVEQVLLGVLILAALMTML